MFHDDDHRDAVLDAELDDERRYGEPSRVINVLVVGTSALLLVGLVAILVAW
ncbi:MAG: hypothetical protein ABI950_07105 [Solirubrobacteraceae bacterium]